MTLAEQIKNIRIKARYTQKEFAEAIQVTQMAVSAYERGISKPRYDVLVLIDKFAKKHKIKASLLKNYYD